MNTFLKDNRIWFKEEQISENSKFKAMFDSKTGFYARSGIIIDGHETNSDPFMSEFPELLDVGIMGHCTHGNTGLCIKAGVQCYQDGLHSNKPNMKLEDFNAIVNQCKGKTFQIALGGCGDPDQHENFEEILKLCRDNCIVPNFTSSGLGFTEQIVELCQKYCGAVAISWYRQDHTLRALQMLLDHKVKTNIHYVLGNNTIDEAIAILKGEKKLPEGINAVIFLLHKPVGLGTEANVLKYTDDKVKHFFELVDNGHFPFKIGFDSCSVPGIVNFTSNIDRDSLDTCEGGRWSGYITADMKMLPCSFDNQEQKWAVDLYQYSIQDAWLSPTFDDFRNHFRSSCNSCKDREACMGGCPIRNQIVLCNREEKDCENQV